MLLKTGDKQKVVQFAKSKKASSLNYEHVWLAGIFGPMFSAGFG